MTLMPVETSPVLRMISKAAAIDPEGTHELVRLALYETLCDQVDAARPYLERDLDEFIAKRDTLIREELVRQYVIKRENGEDVEEVLKAAAEFAVVSKENFSLTGAATPDNKQTRWWDARNVLGQFTSALNAGAKGGKSQGAFDKPRYAGMRATGEALATVNNTDAKVIGGTMAAIGQLGPEAERVLGDGLRRTAYRYRGTEKRPNSRLKRDVASGLAIIDPEKKEQAEAAITAYRDESTTARALAGRPFDKDRSTARTQEGVSASVEVADFWRKQNISQDSKEMRVAGDLAAHYYLDRLPDPQSVALSIASGAVPPSQGVIIDADGDIVSEAMGFNGDHYVPFDLKNLRSLQGGQYVRTRAVGGPTTEDIYTGLLSGARQVQVVSASGVFTMEFDPSVRGGRRYSDKARQMVGRYQRILDAIDQSKQADRPDLFQVDITPQEKRKLYQAAAEKYSDEDEIEAEVKRQVKATRAQRSFKALTEDEIDAQARARLKQEGPAPRSRLAELRREVADENRKESVKRFQLDGDGYEAALNALKTEFPYFVREVTREPLPDFVEARGLQKKTSYSGATDQGYVSPSSAKTGIARAALKNHAIGRRAEDAPEDKRRSTDTQEGAEAVTGAPGAAPKAAGDVVNLANAAKDPKYRTVVGLAGGYVAQAAELFNVPAGQADALESDGDWNVNLPAGVVTRIVLDKAGSDLPGYIDKMGPNERKAFTKALRELPEALESYNIPASEKATYIQSASELSELMDLAEPFGPGEDPKNYLPTQHNSKPFGFPQITKLGVDKAAYDEFLHKARTSEDSSAQKLVQDIEYLDELAPVDRAPEVATIVRTLTLTEVEDNQDYKTTLRDALSMQMAYSFVAAREKAKRYAELTRRKWGAEGKASAPQEGATASQQDFLKRHVEWHPTGTELADRLQQLLAGEVEPEGMSNEAFVEGLYDMLEGLTGGERAEPSGDELTAKPKKPGKIIGTGGTSSAPRVVNFGSGRTGKTLWEKAGLSKETFEQHMETARRLSTEDRAFSERFREADEAGDMAEANKWLTKIRLQNEANKLGAELRAAVLDGDQERIAGIRARAQKYLGS